MSTIIGSKEPQSPWLFPSLVLSFFLINRYSIFSYSRCCRYATEIISLNWKPAPSQSCGGIFMPLSCFVSVIACRHLLIPCRHGMCHIKGAIKCVAVLLALLMCNMEGKNAAAVQAVSEEPADAAAQEATLLREEQQVAAETRPRQKESGRKRKREDADLAIQRSTTGAAAAVPGCSSSGAGALIPRCRCSTRLSLSPLQRLLDACRRVFNGSSIPPTSAIVPFIQGLMEKIEPHDVGLTEELNFFHRMNAAARQNPPIITCKTIHDSSNFTIAVFFLPLRAVMPLHDHPGMTVFSKLLIGSAHVEAYDWVHPHVTGLRSAKLAEKVLDRDITEESKTWVLFPDSGGNMHRFVAGEETHCAFLDVLAPPYSSAEQPNCTYYKDTPYEPCHCALRSGLVGSQRQGRRLAWLEEVAEPPRDFRITNLPYRGPTLF